MRNDIEYGIQVEAGCVKVELAEACALKARDSMVRKDKQLMLREKKIKEQETVWSKQEKTLHQRSMHNAQVRVGLKQN